MKRKVYVVDDHPMMRRGYACLVNAEPDLAVCGEAANASAALAGVEATEPDLVIADISIEGTNGIELTKQLLTWRPDLPVLIISMHDEALYAERALQAGARGYLMKMEGDESVLRAIRRVLDGHVYVSDAVQDRLLYQHIGQARPHHEDGAATALHALSDRELEVFEMIGRGYPTREIADRLSISPKTVESHRAKIKSKLGVDTATDLMRRAMRWVESIGSHPAPSRGT
ncbi:MAG: response regulator transcription factor [Rhodothermales bacterium]